MPKDQKQDSPSNLEVKKMPEVKKEPDIHSSRKFVFLVMIFSLGILSFIHFGNSDSLVDGIKDIFKRSIGDYQTELLFSVLLGTFVIMIIFFIIFFIWDYYLGRVGKRRIDYGFIIMIDLMFGAFIFGFFFIDQTIGTQVINGWALQNPDRVILGHVRCFSNSTSERVIFINETVVCNLKTDLSLFSISSRVEIKLNNGSVVKSESSGDTLSFIALENTRYLTFYLSGANSAKKNRLETLSVGYFHKFDSLIDYEQKKRTFLIYTLSLLAVIFVTIPLSINEIRRAWDRV